MNQGLAGLPRCGMCVNCGGHGYSQSHQNFSIDSPARSTMFRQSAPVTPKPQPAYDAHAKPLYVIVYGYPLDKYSITADYFRSLGDTTEPEQNPEIMNCFRVGYTNPVEAVRAIRKNGEILAGAWMVGVKWAVSRGCYLAGTLS